MALKQLQRSEQRSHSRVDRSVLAFHIIGMSLVRCVWRKRCLFFVAFLQCVQKSSLRRPRFEGE